MTIRKLYDPLSENISGPVYSLLSQYDLPAWYAINTRLVRLIDAIRPSAELGYGSAHTSDRCKKLLQAMKEDISSLTGIIDYLQYETLQEEILKLKYMDAAVSSLADFVNQKCPALQSLFILQQVVGERINSSPQESSKAERFLESHVLYPSDGTNNEDEAIIYCLTRKNKSSRVKEAFDCYLYGKSVGSNPNIAIENIRVKEFLDKRHSTLKECIINQDQMFATGTDLLEEQPNCLRLLQKNSIQCLCAQLLHTKVSPQYDYREDAWFHLLRPFAVFKSELAITVLHKELEQLLYECHEILKWLSADIKLKDRYFGRSGTEEITGFPGLFPLGFVSLFVFGCNRIQSKMIKKDTYNMAFKYLMEWKNQRSQPSAWAKHPLIMPSVSMVVHALSQITQISNDSFAQEIKSWLLSKQHRYGYWRCKLDVYNGPNEDPDEELLYTTVMVLDALELLSIKPSPTFDTKFVFHAGKDNEDRPLKRKLSKCRRIAKRMNESDPFSVTLDGKVCHNLSPTQIRIANYMEHKQSELKKKVVKFAWKESPDADNSAIYTMLDKMNKKLHQDGINTRFYLRKNYIVKEKPPTVNKSTVL
jgi:hypothetical protein